MGKSAISNFYLMIFLLFFPIYCYENFHPSFFIPREKFHHNLNNTPFNLLSVKTSTILYHNQIETLPLPYPYTDYTKNYFVNYSSGASELSLYHINKLILNVGKAYSYPRISYPYLFFISNEQTKLEAYSLKNLHKKVFEAQANDIISSWEAYKNGNIILSELSGTIIIYDKKKNRTIRKKTPSATPFIQGVGILGNSLYYAIGGSSPKKIFYFTTKGSFESIEIKNHQTSNIHLIKTTHYAFLPDEHGFEFFSYDKNSLSKRHFIHPSYSKLFEAEEMLETNKGFILGYIIKPNFYQFDILNTKGVRLKNFVVKAQSIPIIKKIKQQYYILWEEGAIQV